MEQVSMILLADKHLVFLDDNLESTISEYESIAL